MGKSVGGGGCVTALISCSGCVIYKAGLALRRAKLDDTGLCVCVRGTTVRCACLFTWVEKVRSDEHSWSPSSERTLKVVSRRKDEKYTLLFSFQQEASSTLTKHTPKCAAFFSSYHYPFPFFPHSFLSSYLPRSAKME